MAKYLLEVRYNSEGAKGLARSGGSERRDVVSKMLQGFGGTLECFYFAFGEVDAYVIVDVADQATMAAAALAVNQAGAATVRTVVLLTPEDVDKAAKVTMDYTPPRR
ncbi:hypothetical protein STAQ_31080 [Allostella sp. ATCC 35155]|nr:hypothetical protein STAQ_31080 [Stella sp. ATCC 35155]